MKYCNFGRKIHATTLLICALILGGCATGNKAYEEPEPGQEPIARLRVVHNAQGAKLFLMENPELQTCLEHQAKNWRALSPKSPRNSESHLGIPEVIPNSRTSSVEYYIRPNQGTTIQISLEFYNSYSGGGMTFHNTNSCRPTLSFRPEAGKDYELRGEADGKSCRAYIVGVVAADPGEKTSSAPVRGVAVPIHQASTLIAAAGEEFDKLCGNEIERLDPVTGERPVSPRPRIPKD